VLERHHGGDHFIFVDLRGGSCWRVAKMLVKEYPALKVISGVNIPMLVSFLSKKHDHRLDELVKIIETDAHRGIVFE
jgi:mannose/fructose-specific phosphotransferase system component IIA